jgi:hypothetical protein
MGCKGLVVLASVVLTLAASSAHAVILYSQPDRNVSPPTGKLAGSGWQWEGQFGSFLGTPIAPSYFITAGHVGGVPGQPFFFNGKSYNTIAYYDDPASDLRIWKIDGTFPTWAPLFKESTEAGRSCMIFGRGTQRGDPVFVGGELKGWEWGAQDGIQSWGRNAIAGIVDGGAKRGDMLYFTFDQSGVAQEGTLSAGDSGGALFVKQGGAWKLAGVNTSVDGPYAYRAGETSFNAALFDRGGLFVPGYNDEKRIVDSAQDYPAAAYATRISTNLAWITDVLAGRIAPGGTAERVTGGVPEPTGAIITVLGLSALALRRRRARPAE